MKEDFENSIGPPIYFPMANENHRLEILRPKVHHEGLGRGTLEGGELQSRRDVNLDKPGDTSVAERAVSVKKTIAESIF